MNRFYYLTSDKAAFSGRWSEGVSLYLQLWATQKKVQYFCEIWQHLLCLLKGEKRRMPDGSFMVQTLGRKEQHPTWTSWRSWMHLSLTSSKGHRLESIRRWAKMSFRSLLSTVPVAGGDDVRGPMASTFLVTSWEMISIASSLVLRSRLPSLSHLPKDSWSCTSIIWHTANAWTVSQPAKRQK